ncbi:hypothetical protein ACFQ07_00620, partial [Actinomadura adrarensis]
MLEHREHQPDQPIPVPSGTSLTSLFSSRLVSTEPSHSTSHPQTLPPADPAARRPCRPQTLPPADP